MRLGPLRSTALGLGVVLAACGGQAAPPATIVGNLRSPAGEPPVDSWQPIMAHDAFATVLATAGAPTPVVAVAANAAWVDVAPTAAFASLVGPPPGPAVIVLVVDVAGELRPVDNGKVVQAIAATEDAAAAAVATRCLDDAVACRPRYWVTLATDPLRVSADLPAALGAPTFTRSADARAWFAERIADGTALTPAQVRALGTTAAALSGRSSSYPQDLSIAVRAGAITAADAAALSELGPDPAPTDAAIVHRLAGGTLVTALRFVYCDQADRIETRWFAGDFQHASFDDFGEVIATQDLHVVIEPPPICLSQ